MINIINEVIKKNEKLNVNAVIKPLKNRQFYFVSVINEVELFKK